MPALILTMAAATLLMAPVVAQDQKSNRRVKELQKERIVVLKELVEGATKLYQNARVDYFEVIDARTSLFKAELEAAEKQTDRIAVCKAMVDEWKDLEKVAEARVMAGRGTKVAVFKFKAMRLEAEILLEQAQAQKAAAGPKKIGVPTPQTKNGDITEQYVCQIHSQRHITIRALQKGYLEEVLIKEGQAVKQGQVLFRISPVLYRARLETKLAEAKIASVEFDNIERLFKNKVVSQQEVVLHQAKLERAKAEVEFAKAELAFTEIRAPFDGVVDRLLLQKGSLVKDQDVLTTLSDNQVMWVYFNMPEARFLDYLALPAKDRDCKVELILANGSKFTQTGKIGSVNATFNADQGLVPFRADFPNPDGLLRHGMTGNVRIHRAVNNAPNR
jgi:RND family efflux transporter MFP subunit